MDGTIMTPLPLELLQRHLISDWTGEGHKNERPACGAPEPKFGRVQKTKTLVEITCADCLSLTPEGRALIDERTHDYWPGT